MKKLAKQVGSAKKQTMGSKLSYVKKNWQLDVFFLMPALLLTIIFKYLTGPVLWQTSFPIKRIWHWRSLETFRMVCLMQE